MENIYKYYLKLEIIIYYGYVYLLSLGISAD